MLFTKITKGRVQLKNLLANQKAFFLILFYLFFALLQENEDQTSFQNSPDNSHVDTFTNR